LIERAGDDEDEFSVKLSFVGRSRSNRWECGHPSGAL
jgi:hypothetical protein